LYFLGHRLCICWVSSLAFNFLFSGDKTNHVILPRHPTDEEIAQKCPSAASGLLEVTNDIFNNMFVWDGKCNTFKMKCFSKFFFLNIFDNVFFFSSNSNTLQIKKPFFFTGTKTVGLSLSASYDPNIDVPDPQKSERAYLKIDRKRRAARRAARRAERVESVLSVPGTMEEYQEFYEELNDISSEGLTREQQLARLACTIEEAKTQNAA
jgi:hypothetical protein